MLALFLCVVFSVLLLVNFRLHATWKVQTPLAILLNYTVCFLTGLAMNGWTLGIVWPAGEVLLPVLALGLGFVVVFLLSGYSTQKNGMSANSLASNLSLVIPVLYNLLVLNAHQAIGWQTYVGLALAFASIYLFNPAADKQHQGAVLWALLAVFLAYGISNTSFNVLNARWAPSIGGTVPFMLLALMGSMTAGWVVALILLWRGKLHWDTRSVLAAIPLGLPNFFSFYFMLKALDAYQNHGGIVLPIYNIGTIALTALVAWVFFKEKLSPRQGWGLGLGAVAIYLLL